MWVTGDATPTRVGTVDWTGKKFAASSVRDFLPALKANLKLSEKEEDVIIAIAELLNYVTFAATRGPAWFGKMVVYGGDNTNVDSWIRSRKASSRVARFLLQVLCAVESVYQFQTISAWLRTYHNVTADELTRESRDIIEGIRDSKGLEEIDLLPAWAQHLDRGWVRRALVWEGQDETERQVALQLAAKRDKSCVPLQVIDRTPGKTVHVHEWKGTCGGYALAAQKCGMGASLCLVTGGPPLKSKILQTGMEVIARDNDFCQTDVLVSSLTEDSGEEAAPFAKAAELCGARVVVCDAPKKANLDPLRAALAERHFRITEQHVVSSGFGDKVAKPRIILHAEAGGSDDGDAHRWSTRSLIHPARKC